MSFKVNLYYSFSKRDNSTKQPAQSAATEYDCILKAGSGMMKPVLSFNFGTTTAPGFNYAYIPAFGRYYFIEEWYFEDALWTANLKIDVLATYKSSIGSASLYVLRAAGDHNGNIIDTLYPVKTGCSFVTETVTNPWWDNMTYIVGTVSRSGNMGSLAYYSVSSANLLSICQNLLDNTVTTTNGFDWTDCSQALQLSLVDPLQYIKTCLALPVGDGDVTGSLARVYAFNWDTGVNGKKLYQAPYITKTFSFDIHKHPDTNSRGNYVNSAPYTYMTLTIPPFGTFTIDTTVTCNASSLSAHVRLDPITGKAILRVTCNGTVLNRIESQLGVPISLSSVVRDYVGAASAAIGAVGGAVGGAAGGARLGGIAGGIAGALLGSASGIGNAAEALMPRASTIGGSGGFAGAMGSFRLDHQFFRPVDDDNTHNGRPLCEMRTINTLSGYILVQDGDVATNGTSSEDAAIRSYLETGFYYE